MNVIRQLSVGQNYCRFIIQEDIGVYFLCFSAFYFYCPGMLNVGHELGKETWHNDTWSLLGKPPSQIGPNVKHKTCFTKLMVLPPLPLQLLCHLTTKLLKLSLERKHKLNRNWFGPGRSKALLQNYLSGAFSGAFQGSLKKLSEICGIAMNSLRANPTLTHLMLNYTIEPIYQWPLPLPWSSVISTLTPALSSLQLQTLGS